MLQRHTKIPQLLCHSQCQSLSYRFLTFDIGPLSAFSLGDFWTCQAGQRKSFTAKENHSGGQKMHEVCLISSISRLPGTKCMLVKYREYPVLFVSGYNLTGCIQRWSNRMKAQKTPRKVRAWLSSHVHCVLFT